MSELTDLPEVVEPRLGAAEVTFPWAAAERVLLALEQTYLKLSDQLGLRPSMLAHIADWAGQHRDDYDAKYSQVVTDAGYLAEDCGSPMTMVIEDAEAANARQRSNNTDAEDEATARRAEERLL